MTVFLGDSGRIMLIRKGSDQIMYATMNPSDVREDVNRFSIDFAHEQVLTGDRLQISTVGGEDLNWINHPDADKSFTRYVHVDEAGGIRLYDSFSDAIRAVPEKAVDIIKPPSNQRVFFKILSADDEARCLAEVTNYQITTTRETIDTTNLGAYYRKQYEAGLVQGQGRIECLWRKPDTNCELFDTPRIRCRILRLPGTTLHPSRPWCCVPWPVFHLRRRRQRHPFCLVRERNLHRH